MEKLEYEKMINGEIYNIINELFKNNTFIDEKDKEDILLPLKILASHENLAELPGLSKAVIFRFQKQYLSIKSNLESLTISEDIHDSERRKVKKQEFLNLTIYLLTKVKHYFLTNRDVRIGNIYNLIQKDYLDMHKELEEHLAGFSTGVKDDESGHSLLIYAGRVSSDEESFKIDENTRFDMASVTKMFVAIEALKLQEQNLYNLFKPVSSYLNGKYKHLNMTVESLAKFKHKVITDGRLDENVDFLELDRRLRETKEIMRNTHLYSDIPYMILGDTLPHMLPNFKEIFHGELGLSNTDFDNSFGNLTGGLYGRLDIVHDPKAKILKQYGIYSGHAGIYSTSEDLLKLFDGMSKGFLDKNSFETLITQDYKEPIIYNHDGTPVIQHTSDGRAKYQNVNRAMGVYIPHPYGIRHTEIPDIASDKTFGATGFTGCYTVYDIPNGISANICTNPFSSKTRVVGLNQTENDLKIAQFHYVIALRLFKSVLEKRFKIEEKVRGTDNVQKVLRPKSIYK